MKQVYTSDTARSAEAKTAFSGIPGSYVFTNIPGKERPRIVVQHNVEGSGRPVENVALYCTRFKFAAYSTYISLNGEESDAWQKAVLAIEGVTEVASCQHNGLYDLTVKKATAFGWDEIEPKVLELLARKHAELSLKADLRAPLSMDASDGAEWRSPHGAPEYVPPQDGVYRSTGYNPREAQAKAAEDVSMCDDHSWAGQGRCPHCVTSEEGR
jgi:hypothetical protein